MNPVTKSWCFWKHFNSHFKTNRVKRLGFRCSSKNHIFLYLRGMSVCPVVCAFGRWPKPDLCSVTSCKWHNTACGSSAASSDPAAWVSHRNVSTCCFSYKLDLQRKERKLEKLLKGFNIKNKLESHGMVYQKWSMLAQLYVFGEYDFCSLTQNRPHF